MSSVVTVVSLISIQQIIVMVTMLRTVFPTCGMHIDDHLALHQRYNTSIYAGDYANLQEAIDAAVAENLPLYLAPQTYNLASTLTVSGTPSLGGAVQIWGAGSQYTRFQATGANPFIRAECSVNLCGIRLAGTGGETGILYVETGFGALIEDCTFHLLGIGIDTQVPYGAGVSVHFTETRRCLFNGINGYGIRLRQGHHAHRITDCHFQNGLDTGVGIQTGTATNEIYITRCSFSGNMSPSRMLAGIILQEPEGIYIRDCRFEDVWNYGVQALGRADGENNAQMVSITECAFVNNTNPASVGVQLRNAETITVNGSYIAGPMAWGIDGDATVTDVVLINNAVITPGVSLTNLVGPTITII